MTNEYDAVVVGSGPNGFSAAITLAQKGLSVLIIEGKEKTGGGMRSAELTLPGFVHDVCSTIHPLGVSSPFFESLPLDKFNLKWIFSPIALAHPLDDQRVALLYKSIDQTVANLGEDSETYKNIVTPIVEQWDIMKNFFLGPFTIPRHPFAAARFGFYGFQSSDFFTKRYFKDERTRLMFSGISAHSMMPLNKPLTNSFGLLMAALGHVAGWPLAEGGSQKIADALQAYFISLGGQIITNHPVKSLKDIPPAKAILFDLTPKQILNIVGDKFPENYRKKLAKYRYGAGVFKIDWALSSPIPFKNPECSLSSTVHIGGTQQEIIDSEKSLITNHHSESPFVILTQNSLFDSRRAPKDKHTAWAYCHVPNGSSFDMTEIIENKIEKFAPGFKECILQRHTMNTVQIEQYNPNYIGGDINGGIQDIWQFYSRPVLRISPYTTPVKGIYICSSSTPPGGGVHGMCGYHAAQAVLKDIFL